MRTISFVSATLFLVLVGCGKDDPKGNAEAEAEADTGASESSTTAGASTTSGETPTTSGTSAAEETGGGLLVGKDIPSTDKECDVFAQDCPEGEKCMPWANDGSTSWNAAKCSAIAENAKFKGDACKAEGNGVAGVDDCGISLICWFLDIENNGVCTDMCTGTIDAPKCPDPQQVCDISNEGVIAICLNTCNPLTQDCPPDQICFNTGSPNFICDMDASGDGGQYLDPCVYVNECDYGLYCALQAGVPGCTNPDGCCSSYCSLSDPECPPDTMCQPWYGDEMPPPGQEDIGFCEIPQ